MSKAAWPTLTREFQDYHKHPLNVALHLITTPAAIFAAGALLAQYAGSTAMWTVAGAWTLALAVTVPIRLWLATALTMALLSLAAVATAEAGYLSAHGLAALFAVAYFGQDLSHWATGEPTFQASYFGKRQGWIWTFLAHTHHLVPLCFDACWHIPPAPIFVQRRQVIKGKLHGHPEVMAALHKVGSWGVAQQPPKHVTTHWWWYDLSQEASAAFRQVAHSRAVLDLFSPLFPPSSHVVAPLEGMNEVYVAASSQSLSSDNVFYMNHVDGPFGVFPLVHVYRCMCACTDNSEIETIFPMEGDDSRCTLSTGELAGFDFHRELHRIARVEGGKANSNPRICLKLHYAVYPRALGPLGRLLGLLTTYYNQTFRSLFLSTIAPGSAFARVSALAVLGGTLIFNNIETVVGWANVGILATLLGASWLAGSYRVFFYATSFVHYIVYMSTYTYRQRGRDAIAFGAFKRDALLYKSLALAQATVQYGYLALAPTALPDQPNLPSLALLAAGFGLATLAASRLGVDRTYFGWELGHVDGDYVQRFPYGSIPHPMILGGMIGWLGFHALPAFRLAHPYYAPLHVALYAAHACQEHASIHHTGLLQSSSSAKPATKAAPAKAASPKPTRPNKSPARNRSPARSQRAARVRRVVA